MSLQNHIEGYRELSSKTQTYFSTAVAKWDADFYIKVDDDVHINLGRCIFILAQNPDFMEVTNAT